MHRVLRVAGVRKLVVTGTLVIGCQEVTQPSSAGVSARRQDAPAITITDLGTLGGDYSLARDVNNQDQVVGESRTSDGVIHAFLWENGVMTDLGTGGGVASGASGINERGQVVGAWGGGSSPDRGFLWENGRMVGLVPLPGRDASAASAINERGQVVGVSSGLQMPGNAVLWDGASITDLGVLPATELTSSLATSINNRGQVVGISGPTEQLKVGFIWAAGVMTALPSVRASAINNLGQIAGVVEAPIPGSNETSPYPALLDNGNVLDLRTAEDEVGMASDINNRGQVVGLIGTMVSFQAFMWYQGVMTRLPGLGGGESSALAINERGHVVGVSRTSDGELHAVMWTIR